MMKMANNIEVKEDLDEQLRYGISALDLKYKEYSVKDELLVNGHDGKMFYKRESDGQIVTSDNLEYNKDELISAINDTLSSNEKIPVLPTDYIVYNTIDIAEKNSILSSGISELNLTHSFPIQKVNSGFFIRIRGNNTTNAIVSKLTNDYKSKHPDDETSSVLIKITISESSTDYSEEKMIGVDFDTLTFVKLSPSSPNCTGYNVIINSIEYTTIKLAYNSSLHKNDMINLNYGNINDDGLCRLEADMIDFIYYVDNINDIIISDEDEGIKLQYTLPVSDTDKDIFVLSDKKPNHKCLWAKIIE